MKEEEEPKAKKVQESYKPKVYIRRKK